jgi:hypothetical protein
MLLPEYLLADVDAAHEDHEAEAKLGILCQLVLWLPDAPFPQLQAAPGHGRETRPLANSTE